MRWRRQPQRQAPTRRRASQRAQRDSYVKRDIGQLAIKYIPCVLKFNTRTHQLPSAIFCNMINKKKHITAILILNKKLNSKKKFDQRNDVECVFAAAVRRATSESNNAGSHIQQCNKRTIYKLRRRKHNSFFFAMSHKNPPAHETCVDRRRRQRAP